MVSDDEYEQKFSTLISALNQARALHESSTPETRQKIVVEWEKLKVEFNSLVSSHRQGTLS